MEQTRECVREKQTSEEIISSFNNYQCSSQTYTHTSIIFAYWHIWYILHMNGDQNKEINNNFFFFSKKHTKQPFNVYWFRFVCIFTHISISLFVCVWMCSCCWVFFPSFLLLLLLITFIQLMLLLVVFRIFFFLSILNRNFICFVELWIVSIDVYFTIDFELAWVNHVHFFFTHRNVFISLFG